MSAILLQNGKQAFTDANSRPLAGGKVYFYVPNTNTPKDTWQDSAQTILNTNPVVLDARGEASIYGSGPYRQILRDASNVLIWDAFIPDLVGSIQSAIDDIYSKNSVQVLNIAALKALSSTVYNHAHTDGYYSVADGGDNSYYLDKTDTTSADDGGSVIVANDGGRWKTESRISMDIRQWGIIPIGMTGPDTGLQIQRASIFCAANSIKLIFHGVCRVLTAIEVPSNTSWVGSPVASLYLDPAMTVGPLIGGTGRCVYGSNKSNISIIGMDFYSSSTGATKPITICFDTPTGLKVKDCSFRSFGTSTYYAQGLIVFGGTDVRLHDSKFNDNSGDGCALSNGTTEYTVDNCQFLRNGDWGLALVIACNNGSVTNNTIATNVSTGTGTDRCKNVSFIGNKISGNEHGIRIAEFAISTDKNQAINIIGNSISNSNVAGISVEGMAASFGMYTVSGNTINGTVGQGIRVVDADGGVVSNNTIYSSGAEGILFNASTSGRITGDCTVTGNTIIACTTGIRQVAGAGTTGNITVAQNQIVSASVQSIGLLVSDYIDSSPANYMTISKPLNLNSGLVASTATLGGAVLPTAPQGFIPIWIGGVKRLIPFYNV